MAFQVSIQPSGLGFQLDDGRTILEGALADGLMLRHACRSGCCGSCKGQVVSGSVDHGNASLEILSEEEREAGIALFCCATATSDLVIHAPEIAGQRDAGIRQMTAHVVSIDKVANDVAIVRLMLPPNANYSYAPGQYTEFLLNDGVRRAYSMATRAPVDNQLEFHIRHMPGGVFSSFVFNGLQPQARLRLEGPYGSFYLRDTASPIIMLASGTGLAPIQALLEQLREQNNTRPVYLYWGGRTRKDLYRHEQLLALESELPWLRYTAVLSEPTADCDWQGETGFVHLQVLKDFKSLRDFEVYACGAPIMVESARRDYVEQVGLRENNFFADAFV